MDVHVRHKSWKRHSQIFNALREELCRKYHVSTSPELNHRGRNLLGVMQVIVQTESSVKNTDFYTSPHQLRLAFAQAYCAIKRYHRLLRNHPEYARLETITDAGIGAFPEWVNDPVCADLGAVGYVQYCYNHLESIGKSRP